MELISDMTGLFWALTKLVCCAWLFSAVMWAVGVTVWSKLKGL